MEGISMLRRLLTPLLALLLAATPAWALQGGTNISVQDGVIALTGTVAVANGGTGVTSAPDDNILIGNGTIFQNKPIPDCDDTGGNHLNYDTATNTPTCGTSSPASITPPLAFATGMDITTSKTMFVGPGTLADATEAVVQTPLPAGTYGKLRCNNGAIQGVGNNVTVTVRSGACGSQADSSVTCTVTGSAAANQACSDTTNTITPSAGHCVDVKVVTPATLTANARVACSMERTA
jgi:hypothetical protein